MANFMKASIGIFQIFAAFFFNKILCTAFDIEEILEKIKLDRQLFESETDNIPKQIFNVTHIKIIQE